MEKQEMVRLLFYEKKKIMMEGENLVELANMYHLSVRDFMELFELYLRMIQAKLMSGYSISNGRECILNNPQGESHYEYNGELFVPVDGYEDMKKKVFDFAYTKCSKIGNTSFKSWGLDAEFWDPKLNAVLNEESPEYYSCIYQSAHGGWNQKVSNVRIDKEEQTRIYSLLKKDKSARIYSFSEK